MLFAKNASGFGWLLLPCIGLVALAKLPITDAGVYALKAGAHFTCASEHENSTFACWGTPEFSDLPTSVPVDYDSFYVGKDHMCGFTQDSEFTCWGSNPELTTIPDVVAANITDEYSIAVGGSQTCIPGISVDPSVTCFGIANGDSLTPPTGLGTVARIDTSTTGTHTCVIAESGNQNVSTGAFFSISCWGCNEETASVCDDIPTEGPQFAYTNIYSTILAVGRAHACVVDSYSKIFCWGDNTFGQTNVLEDAKGDIFINKGGQRMVAGDDFTCVANTAGGAIKCWGRTDIGVLEVPEDVQQKSVTSISAGAEHVCAVYQIATAIPSASSGDRYAQCWGQNTNGQVSPVPSFVDPGPRDPSSASSKTVMTLIGGAVFASLVQLLI